MKAFRIMDLKNFMNKLLLSETFDSFLLEEGMVTTYNTFQIDGHIMADFYTSEEKNDSALYPYDFSVWKEMRPLCFQLIKGKRTPLNFKFVLLLIPEQVEKLLADNGLEHLSQNVKSFTLTVKYDGSTATLLTGISTHSFQMDKSPEQLWDNFFRQFMDKNLILWEEL